MKGFISRQRLAELLDLKTATLGSWDRRGRGVGGRGPVYLSATSVVYRIEDVEEFLEKKLNLSPSFLSPQDRGARRHTAAQPAREPGERLRRPTSEAGGSGAPAESPSEGPKGRAKVVPTKREGEP